MPADSPPRLLSGDQALAGYAPVSWTAVGSLAVSGTFVVILVAMGYFAFADKKPLIESWLLAFPALGVVLAFVARRQIRAAEGTRTGVTYANAGWWLAVVAGLGYVTYLAAIEFSIRRDAEREFVKFADHLKELDVSDAKDPNLYAAAHLTLDPGVRTAVSPKDIAGMDASFREQMATFRQSDLVRICSRNRGKVAIRVSGLKDWQQKPDQILCTLAATLTTPEGEHEIQVGLRAIVDKSKVRRWQIISAADGYIRSRTLTRYGWLVEHLEEGGARYAQTFMSFKQAGNQPEIVYQAFVKPDTDFHRVADMVDAYNRSMPGRAAVAGPVSTFYYPPSPGTNDYLEQSIYAKPDGSKPTPEELLKFGTIWRDSGRLVNPGTFNMSNNDKSVVAIPSPTAFDLRRPVEMALGTDPKSPVAVRGRVVVRITPASDSALFADLAAAMAASPTAPRSAVRPTDLPNIERLNWRVIRIESDLKPIGTGIEFTSKGR